mgnify:CR=1 FL=1
MDIEEHGYKDWAVDVEPGDANSYPTEDSIEHVYVVVTDKHSGEVYEGKLFLVQGVTAAPPDSTSFKSSGEFPGSAPPEPGSASPEGETLAKRQEEYFDSVREERSRELIKHIQQEMRDREFRR